MNWVNTRAWGFGAPPNPQMVGLMDSEELNERGTDKRKEKTRKSYAVMQEPVMQEKLKRGGSLD